MTAGYIWTTQQLRCGGEQQGHLAPIILKRDEAGMDPCYRANRPQNTIGFQYTHKWTPLLPSGGPIDATILTRTSIDRCLPTSLDIIVAIDEMMSVTWHVVSWSCHDIEVSIIPQAIAALHRSEWSKLLSACWWFPPAWAIRYENQLGSLSSLKKRCLVSGAKTILNNMKGQWEGWHPIYEME